MPAAAEPDQPFEPLRDTGPPVPAARAYTWIGGIAAIIAAACYSSFLLSPWTHAARSAGSGFISELEAPGQPFAWLYRTSDVLAGLGVVIAAWAVYRLIAGRRWSATAVVLFALAGASSVLDAATSMQCDPNTSTRCAQGEHTAAGLVSQLVSVHTDSGLLGFIGGAAGASILGVVIADRWVRWGRLQIAFGIGIASCGLADIVLLLVSGSIGWTERIRVLLTSGWFLAVGLFLLHENIVSRRARNPPGTLSRAAGQPARTLRSPGER